MSERKKIIPSLIFILIISMIGGVVVESNLSGWGILMGVFLFCCLVYIKFVILNKLNIDEK